MINQRRAKVRRLIFLISVLTALEAHAQTPPDPTATPPEPIPTSHLRFALQLEPQFGVSGGKFFNQLIGARLDYRFTPTLSLGPYLAYANLKGKDGRASQALGAVQLEYRPSLGASSAISLPLRFTPGYLPENGPVLRLSAGLAYAVSPHVDIVLDAFTPTFWVVKNRTLVSLGGALEVSYAP